MADHTCHAEGCDTVIPERLFMCRRHWFMVPRVLQLEVWQHYVPGQEVRKDPSSDYLTAAERAIDHVARTEGRRP